MIRSFFPAALLSFVLASCASDSGSSSSSSESGYRPLSQRLDEKNGYAQDKQGNWVPQTDKRSSFETNRSSSHFKGDYQKKDFKTGEVAKKSWWGKNEYARSTYQGNTDASNLKTSSRFQGQGARETSTAARLPGNYETGTYATGRPRESNTRSIPRPSDAETDVRRKVFTPPSVIDWRSQRNLSIEQSRGVLGR